MLISVVIPAFNEEGYLGETLARLNRAKAFLRDEESLPAEIIVVDNDSDDSTADVARALSATVVRETQHNVAKVRNTGAKLSNGDVLVLVDADTVVPDELLSRIVEANGYAYAAFDFDRTGRFQGARLLRLSNATRR